MMILIRLDNDNWFDIDDYAFYILGAGYIGGLEDEYTDDVEEGYTDVLIDMRSVFFLENFD